MTRLLIGLVRIYQAVLSPWVGDRCRFFPSCSQYMIDALIVHGPWRGTWLGIRRILRCQPLCRGGFDFVPPPVERAESGGGAADRGAAPEVRENGPA